MEYTERFAKRDTLEVGDTVFVASGSHWRPPTPATVVRKTKTLVDVETQDGVRHNNFRWQPSARQYVQRLTYADIPLLTKEAGEQDAAYLEKQHAISMLQQQAGNVSQLGTLRWITAQKIHEAIDELQEIARQLAVWEGKE